MEESELQLSNQDSKHSSKLMEREVIPAYSNNISDENDNEFELIIEDTSEIEKSQLQ